MPRKAISNIKISNDLVFWIKNSSWTYCAFCSSVHKRKLFQSNANRPINKHQTACHCLENRYIVPLFSLIPDCLKTLTFAEICVLRPLNFHYGDYKQMQHGYEQKNGMCHITWKQTSVQAAINALGDNASKIRCQLAYSSYKIFVDKQQNALESGEKINLYNYAANEGRVLSIQVGVKPLSKATKGKVSFINKLFSNIVDYATTYDLLQFHYDLWIFKTVSGAISSTRCMDFPLSTMD